MQYFVSATASITLLISNWTSDCLQNDKQQLTKRDLTIYTLHSLLFNHSEGYCTSSRLQGLK